MAASNTLPDAVDDWDLENAAAQQETAQKMAEMVDILSHLYKMEEDYQAKTSQTSLALVEEYVAATEPDHAVQELKERLANMELEASRLREELREKETCRRCDARDAAAHRRIHGSTGAE